MNPQEQFLSNRQRYQPITLPQEFSDEELVRDWTLSEDDRQEVEKYRKSYRLSMAIQICAVRLYGRFLNPIHDLSPRIVDYLRTATRPTTLADHPDTGTRSDLLGTSPECFETSWFSTIRRAFSGISRNLDRAAGSLGVAPRRVIPASRSLFIGPSDSPARSFGVGKTHYSCLFRGPSPGFRIGFPAIVTGVARCHRSVAHGARRRTALLLFSPQRISARGHHLVDTILSETLPNRGPDRYRRNRPTVINTGLSPLFVPTG